MFAWLVVYIHLRKQVHAQSTIWFFLNLLPLPTHLPPCISRSLFPIFITFDIIIFSSQWLHLMFTLPIVWNTCSKLFSSELSTSIALFHSTYETLSYNLTGDPSSHFLTMCPTKNFFFKKYWPYFLIKAILLNAWLWNVLFYCEF